MPIRILQPEVANQIAAGEVVERPSSVVKELVENSLDAGAREIRVEVREGGLRLIKVQDDGSGIPAAEAPLAFQRHATSKIAAAADLERITTLGFRGEALASIGSVAQVTLITRTEAQAAAVLLRVSNGRLQPAEPTGGPHGTTVNVEHLFRHVPARLKFLKQPATEAAHIHQVVTRYALAYPERRFSLVSDGRPLLQTTGSGRLHDVLVKVYGLDVTRQMLPVGRLDAARDRDDETPGRPGIIVSGYAAAPGLHRANRSYVTLFVNHRWFQNTTIAYSVIQAYHSMIPTGRYPVALIFIETDPGELDVNVHPTKAEVRFRKPGAVFSAVQRAVRQSLVAHTPDPMRDEAQGDLPAADAGWAARREALLGAGRPIQSPMPLPAPPGSAAGQALPEAFPLPATRPDCEVGAPLLPLLRVVGQLGATYIVAEGPDGLYMVDQHAAHERVLYEQMLADHATHRLAIQPLLEPLVIALPPEQAGVVTEELETLNELGVEIEAFGPGSYLVRSLPAVLGRDDPAVAVAEIVDGLAMGSDLVEASHEARLISLICKRAAIKGNTSLSLPEMQELVRRLEACRAPRTCPHGRPTMVHVSAAELARRFGRT
jgi:DNA mismatch repair protein MutL